MKKFLLVLSASILAISASAQEVSKTTFVTDGSETLYIIDGVVSSKTAADRLSSDEIKNMSVVKNISQAVIIRTQSGRTVSGRVVDENRNPIFGALIQVKGTSVGTVAGSDGYYEISLPAGKSELTYSFIDYSTVTLEADKADNSTVVLYPEGSEENVKVIAYKSEKKPNTSPANTENSIKIRKRGVDENTEDPLFVVRNAKGEIHKVDNLDSIKPEHIKTMNVYKSADSEERFGQYGDTSNGVIYIELK